MDNNGRDQSFQPLPTFDAEFAAAGDWARLYRTHDIQVVPACSHLEVKLGASWKRPLFRSWVEFQEALVPDGKFNEWYGPQGLYATRLNMGVICGRASDGLFVIDLDTHKYDAAGKWWVALMNLHNNNMELETVEQRTGGGGFQKLFRAPPGWTPPTCKTPIGVDIRGQGGFAMLAPSLHESGKSYEWLDGYSPNEIAIAIAPDWLLDAIDALVREHNGGNVNSPTSGHHVRTADPVSAYDAFGHQVDGREELMRDLVWAAVLDWRRECPIKPGYDEQWLKCEEKYQVYEALVSPRVFDPTMTKAQMLDSEGRGPTQFHVKWAAAMRRWDDKVAEEARLPGKSEGWGKEDIKPPLNPTQPIPLRPAFPIVEAEIPIRDWIIPGLLLRRNLSVLVAPPASGKSLLTLQLAIAVAVGMPWGGWFPRKAEKVLVINAEDDFDEMRRRLFAAAKSMGVRQEDLVDRLFLADAPESIVIAKMDARSKTVIRTPLGDQLVATIQQNGIGLVVVDPFAETFEGDENSNSEVKWAGILWREVARRTMTALWLVHHTKKYAGDMAGVADASRGGGALIGTARILSTLFTMTEDEALAMGIADDTRDRFVRFDDAKANHSAKGKVKWFEKKTIQLNNGTGFVEGDEVGVLSPWKPPGAMDGITVRDLGLALDTIQRGVMADDGRPTGQLFGAHITSKDRWAGHVLEAQLSVSEDRAKVMIKAWLESGTLYTEEYDDPVQRKPRTGVRVDQAKRPDISPDVFT